VPNLDGTWQISTICKKLIDLRNTAAAAKTTLNKGLCKQQPTPEKMMLKEDGSKCENSEENAEVFRKHFKNII